MTRSSTDRINYKNILERYPWIVARGQKCVLSPDADGMLCGLFMSHYFGWEIVGYYDNGKNLILKDGIKSKDCVFLDTEIYRSDVRSIGHHILLLRGEKTEVNLSNYQNCINPNLIRGRTKEDGFSKKYPMGTIHLLLAFSNASGLSIEYNDNAFFVILQADGTINRFVDKYSENLLDWLTYLGVQEDNNALGEMLSKGTDLMTLNKEYVEYVQKFVKTKKDKIPISDGNNLVESSFEEEHTKFSSECRSQIEQYLKFLSEETGWTYDHSKWIFNGFSLYAFTKVTVKSGVRTYNRAVKENLLSLAFTDSSSMAYTIESPDNLP